MSSTRAHPNPPVAPRLSLLLLALLLPGASTFAAPAAPAGPAQATPAPAAAPAASPAPPGRFDDTELRRGGKEAIRGADRADRADRATGTAGAKPGADATVPSYDLPRVLLALGAVVGLIFLLRWAVRRFFGLATVRGSSQVVQVLSRSVLSPKQQLLLVKVGRRVLVASDNGSQLTALSEITDPDEVAALVGQLRTEKDSGAAGASSTKAFHALFGRVKKGYDAGAAAAAQSPYEDDAEDEADMEEEGDGNGQAEGQAEGRADPVDPPGYPAGRAGTDFYAPSGPAHAADAPSAGEQNVVAATRQELSGLLEKVRMVSDQFNRSREPAKPAKAREA